jgi:hypothetical protein
VRPAQVFFEYIGRTGLTVIGPGTRRQYRFDRPGARLAVDPIDQPSLSRVAQLRRVSGPR